MKPAAGSDNPICYGSHLVKLLLVACSKCIGGKHRADPRQARQWAESFG
jgi:hypothetical protein